MGGAQGIPFGKASGPGDVQAERDRRRGHRRFGPLRLQAEPSDRRHDGCPGRSAGGARALGDRGGGHQARQARPGARGRVGARDLPGAPRPANARAAAHRAAGGSGTRGGRRREESGITPDGGRQARARGGAVRGVPQPLRPAAAGGDDAGRADRRTPAAAGWTLHRGARAARRGLRQDRLDFTGLHGPEAGRGGNRHPSRGGASGPGQGDRDHQDGRARRPGPDAATRRCRLRTLARRGDRGRRTHPEGGLLRQRSASAGAHCRPVERRASPAEHSVRARRARRGFGRERCRPRRGRGLPQRAAGRGQGPSPFAAAAASGSSVGRWRALRSWCRRASGSNRSSSG